ncbi:MAG: hypothetical protein QOH74_1304 [Gaiellales bacterium]|jgi:hypothetical protein|nr:hypothetical protein [Gaiellales bacterium]
MAEPPRVNAVMLISIVILAVLLIFFFRRSV